MAIVTVQTDEGAEIWRMEQVESWHLPSLQAPMSRRGSSLAAGIRRAVQDAEAIREGRDPERPSEKAVRLAAEAREEE